MQSEQTFWPKAHTVFTTLQDANRFEYLPSSQTTIQSRNLTSHPATIKLIDCLDVRSSARLPKSVADSTLSYHWYANPPCSQLTTTRPEYRNQAAAQWASSRAVLCLAQRWNPGMNNFTERPLYHLFSLRRIKIHNWPCWNKG